jgi:CshA-type fibril repeat protein
MCFDTSTSSACDGEPYILPGYSHSLGNMGSFAVSDSGRVFITDSKVWCIDADTGSACPGSWPGGDSEGGSFSGNQVHPAIPRRDVEGNLDGACMIAPAGTCWDLSGENVTSPPALLDLLNTYPASDDVGVSNYDFTSTRQYWLTGPWNDPYNTSYPVCWDWTTQSACAGFASNVTNGTLRYAIRVDDTNDTCIWTNGDNGIISVFNALTGAAGCVQPDPTVVFPYTTLVPRMGCDEAGRVRGYRDLTLTVPDAVSMTALAVTVKDSDGNPVAGFTDLNPPLSGSIDLSGLDPAITGTHPSFEVNSPGTSTADAAAITAALRFVSDAPELCLTLASLQDCPTLSAGQSSTPTLPVSDVTIDATTVSIVDELETPTPLSQSVTRADMGNCLGTVSGVGLRTFPGGDVPISGATVDLVGPDSVVAATTTTDLAGAYSFSNINPAEYTVTMAGESVPATVVATEVTTADVSVPVDSPVAAPVSGGTLQNSPASVAIDATVDPTTTVDLESVELWDPEAESWGSEVVVSGEGTWTVTSGGDLKFTPIAGFTGVSSDVTYRFHDGYGTPSDGSTAHVTVTEVLPTADAVTGSGIRGDTISMTPNGVGPNVPLDDTSLALIDVATDDRVSSLTVPGVGTFTANLESGQVDFTPLGDFVGSATVIYRVLDTEGREATATMTVTLDPITLSGDTVTVGQGQTATPAVHGAPAESELTVPSSATGASSLTISGSTVTVVPSTGFAGRITVPVTVVHGSATMTTSVVVLVKPAAVTHGWHDLTARATTVVHWPATPGAVTYEVRVNGVLKCVTSARTCGVAKLLGPKARVTVTAVGHNAVKGTATRQPYRTHGCVAIGAVHFSSNSATLSKSARKKLTRLARVITAQGFTRGCLVGHTDNIGSVAHNKALSKRRVNQVAAYLTHRRPHPVYRKSYNGESNPGSSNQSGTGRAANRIVDISVI